MISMTWYFCSLAFVLWWCHLVWNENSYSFTLSLCHLLDIYFSILHGDSFQWLLLKCYYERGMPFDSYFLHTNGQWPALLYIFQNNFLVITLPFFLPFNFLILQRNFFLVVYWVLKLKLIVLFIFYDDKKYKQMS